MNALFYILALKFMAGGSEGEAERSKEPAGQGNKESGVVKGSELTKGLRRGTKRTWQTGEGPPGDEEPPKDKIYVKGDYMDFKEYLAKRKFLFVHHFSGEVDNLSKALAEECERRGMRFDSVSIDAAQGYDLSLEVPYKHHHEHAGRAR